MSADELIDGWQAAWGSRDAGAFAPLCAPDVHYEDPLTEVPLRGAAAVAEHASRLWAAFPDARIERTGARLGDGRYVAAPFRLQGTHRGALGTVPPTARALVVHGIFYCELDGDLLLRVRAFFDLYAAAVRLGVLPARSTLGEKALMALRGFGLRAGRGA